MRKIFSLFTACLLSVSFLENIAVKANSLSDTATANYALNLQCSEKTYFDDEDTLTYFYVDTDYEGETITLVNADNMTEYTMVDDGKFSVSGDDLPYDGVYSLKMELDTSGVTYENAKKLSFYAVTEDGSTSNTVTITIAKRFTDVQFQEMNAVDSEIEQLCSSENYLSASNAEKTSMMYELLTELALNGTEKFPYSLIQADSITLSDNGEFYEFRYYFGFSGNVMISGLEQEQEPTETTPEATTTEITTTTSTTTTTTAATSTTTISETSAETETFTETTTAPEEIFYGDCNQDDAFNLLDIVLFQKWLLAVPDTNLNNWKAADFCKDDVLNIFDLSLMKKALFESN